MVDTTARINHDVADARSDDELGDTARHCTHIGQREDGVVGAVHTSVGRAECLLTFASAEADRCAALVEA